MYLKYYILLYFSKAKRVLDTERQVIRMAGYHGLRMSTEDICTMSEVAKACKPCFVIGCMCMSYIWGFHEKL
jgi:hypothetical protein